MQWLKDFVNFFFKNLLDSLKWLADAVGEVISWVLYNIYDGFLSVVTVFVKSIDLSSLAFNVAAEYAGLPTQIIWFINQVDFPQFVAYLVGAITIRMILNIIPAAFTRI